jgi:hypothetical protein
MDAEILECVEPSMDEVRLFVKNSLKFLLSVTDEEVRELGPLSYRRRVKREEVKPYDPYQ